MSGEPRLGVGKFGNAEAYIHVRMEPMEFSVVLDMKELRTFWRKLGNLLDEMESRHAPNALEAGKKPQNRPLQYHEYLGG